MKNYRALASVAWVRQAKLGIFVSLVGALVGFVPVPPE